MQFGKNHRFKADPSLGDNPFDTLCERMKRDLDVLRDGEYKIEPDLIICTGDLAEWGLPREFADAFKFLGEIAEHLKLPRERVSVIPGNHDINRKACEAYFANCSAEEATPQFPWFPKWNAYKSRFDNFYEGCSGITFNPDEPWSFFAIPELKVVIAGINSTMREGHPAAVETLPEGERGHYGWCGEKQLRLIEEKLRSDEFRGWLRIGAVHHNVERGCKQDDENLRDADVLKEVLEGELNIILHGHTHQAKAAWVNRDLPIYSTGSAALDLKSNTRPPEIPNQYQILRIHPNRIARYLRAYFPDRQKWGADPRGSKDAQNWVVEDKVSFERADACFPSVARVSKTLTDPKTWKGEETIFDERAVRKWQKQDDFLSRVAAACRLRHPGAEVDEVRREESGRLHYLRVLWKEDGIVHQFPVGCVETDCSPADLQRFHDEVALQYRATDSNLIPRFVCGGRDPHSPELEQKARQLRIRLLSFIEYQGLIDLRGYLKTQTDRLLDDTVYPPALYVPQRMDYEAGVDKFERQDAFESVAAWLRDTDPRFVVILGEFGTGKTFLLYELARRLGDEPGVSPVLIELRGLEKLARSTNCWLSTLPNTRSTGSN